MRYCVLNLIQFVSIAETKGPAPVLGLFTREQEMLREVVADLAAGIGVEHPAALASNDLERGWSELRSVGLCALRQRDDDGTPAASGVEVMIAAEALAARLVPQPYLGTVVLPGELLALAGAPPELQAGVADGAVRGCVLLDREVRGLASAPFHDGPANEAVAWDCAGADFALGVDVASGTVTRHPVTSLDALPAADLTRTVAAVGIGPAEDAWELGGPDLDRWHALALTVLAADVVGAMRGGLDGVVAYTKERVQFGVPVGSFQAVQHLCADATVKIEGASSTVKYAAWAVDEVHPTEALLAARTAKAYTADVARDVGEIVLQVYGGVGQTWEHIAHFFLRRMMLSSQVLGDASVQLALIADARLGVA
jgi:Acyl-CoA dehydrogenase, C-terminal domain